MHRDLMPLDASALLRRIGRGASGSRHLSRHEAQALFEALLANQLPEAVVGAVIIALRVKGETCDELLGGLDALPSFINKVPTVSDRPVVSIPSYNGARNLPNLTWLLALLLAREGIQVIVHGKRNADLRTHTEEVVRYWDRQCHHSSSILASPLESIEHFLQNKPIYLAIETFSPALAALIDRRLELGVRNTAHSLVKMLNPTDRTDCLRITCFTHPEFETLQHQVFEAIRAPAMILRATEGEVVANVRRSSRIDLMNRGFALPVVESEKNFATLDLPIRSDIAGTVNYMNRILDGSIPTPLALAAQVDAIVNAARLPQ